MFTIIGNAGRCIPFIKYDLSINEKQLQIHLGSFLVTFNYYFIAYHYEKIMKNNFYFKDRKLLNSLITVRNAYLEKNNKTILDDTLYKEFMAECIGKTLEFSREFLLRMNERRDKGLKGQISYDPKISRGTYIGYEFENSEGNEIMDNE